VRRLRDLSEPVSIYQVPGNLQPPATSFIGREEQVAAVTEALRTHRLVTLVGVGGVGKTRRRCTRAICAGETGLQGVSSRDRDYHLALGAVVAHVLDGSWRIAERIGAVDG
jgi:hypothetical protein